MTGKITGNQSAPQKKKMDHIRGTQLTRRMRKSQPNNSNFYRTTPPETTSPNRNSTLITHLPKPVKRITTCSILQTTTSLYRNQSSITPIQSANPITSTKSTKITEVLTFLITITTRPPTISTETTHNRNSSQTSSLPILLQTRTLNLQIMV